MKNGYKELILVSLFNILTTRMQRFMTKIHLLFVSAIF